MQSDGAANSTTPIAFYPVKKVPDRDGKVINAHNAQEPHADGSESDVGMWTPYDLSDAPGFDEGSRCGFVKFSKSTEANEARDRFSTVEFAGRPMHIRRIGATCECEIEVSNLATTITEDMLRRTFEQVGTV